MTVSNPSALAYSNQKKLVVLSTGKLVLVISDVATNGKFVASDDGKTWTDLGVDISGWLHGSISSYVDAGGTERLVAVWKQSGSGGGRTDGRIYIMVGSFNAGRTVLTWGAAVDFGAPYAGWNYPDVVAHAEGAGTGGYAHVVISFADGTPRNMTDWFPFSIAGNVPTSGVDAYISPGSPGYSVNANTFPSITINPATKDLYAAWSAGTTGAGKGIRFRKGTYSAGVWTWAAEVDVDTAQYLDQASGLTWQWLRCRWDGTRVVISGLFWNGSIAAFKVYDSSNFTAFTSRVSSGEMADCGGFAVDAATGDVYIVGEGGNYENFRFWKCTRAGAALTLGATVVFESSLQGGPRYVHAIYSPGVIHIVYESGNNSPYQVKYNRILV